MDEHSQPEPEFTHSSARDPESPSHASGMFSNSQQFAVTGGTFTNITKSYTAPGLPSDFRMIPMGDIDLRHEIRLDKYMDIAYSQRQRACVRRMHSAKAIIAGRKSRVTVAIYQGNDAEEEWRQDTTKHMSLRHPNIIQICGAASSNGIHATLFNDDLIPLREILDRHRDSHFTMVYIYAQCNQDFSEVFNYLYSASRRYFHTWDCTNWIRRSTGRLCAELIPASDILPIYVNPPEFPGLLRMYSLSTFPETITTFIDSLTLKQYHHICSLNLRQHRGFNLSTCTMVNLGAVFCCSNDLLEDSVEIALFPNVEAPYLGSWRNSKQSPGEIMPNGWTRFQSGDVFNNTLSPTLSVYLNAQWDTWLSQANHIFCRLNIMSNFEDYVVVDEIEFHFHVLQPSGDPPDGFLFLCPREDFRISSFSVRWPAWPAYWSLDPSGADRLDPEEATALGFPSFKLTASVSGGYWDSSVYEGLRQFHEAKGFDPYSQEVARHLGYPFFRLCSERDALLWDYVDSDDEDFDADIDSDCESAYPDDYESESLLSAGDDSADLDFEAQYLHDEEDAHHAAGENFESDPTEISNWKNYNASQSTLEEDVVAEEIFVPSPTFKIVLYMQLMMIALLALSGVHHHVW
ncbi:hypothetical protein MSAN_00126500 [Mycena sanguinolenta]|uniref:Protein kinase domain-containing protein n=1 Tax=Mycena sanguinolenta TaxID=230812 RepID=A0A8H7DK21_9AGAR|nr:hypothetical protein MSAN_00126500 [Mycena sanguinolenta]